MANKQRARTEPHSADTWDFEQFIDIFETELARQGCANVEDFFPSNTHPEFNHIVVELLRVDFEHRWQRGSTKNLDAYVDEFESVLSDPKYLEPLAFEAYRLHCQTNPQLDPASFATKYNIDTSQWPPASQLGDQSTRDLPPTASDDAWPNVGDSVSDFKLIAEFGRGSFSRVYLAQQGNLANRLVVLKASKHLWKESDLLARLQHSNIVPIHSVHTVGDTQVVCMPFWGTCTLADIISQLDGDTSTALSAETFRSTVANLQNETVASVLRERQQHGDRLKDKSESLQTKKIAADDHDVSDSSRKENQSKNNHTKNSTHVDTCLAIVEQITQGLSHAHQRGIIHGDLKPANVLISDDGRPMILDFNLSVDLDDAFSATGVGGTIPYMAPEHLRKLNGEPGTRTAASDIYSLGVMLFELLCGHTPFPDRGTDLDKVYSQLLSDRENGAPSICSRVPKIPVGVAAIVNKCLAPKLEDRYASAEQLLEDLRQHVSHKPLKHVKEPIRERLRKFQRSNPKLLYGCIATAACLLALTCLAAFTRAQNRTAQIQVAAKLEDFRRDMQWLPASLGTARIDSRQRKETLDRAEHWLDAFSLKEQKRLTKDQRGELDRQTGELLLSLASFHVDRSLVGTGLNQEAHLRKAEDRRDRAASLLLHSDFAHAAIQRDINRLLNGTAPTSAEVNDVPLSALDFETLAAIQRRKGQTREAVIALEQANTISPDDYSIWLQLGNAYAEQLSHAKAERCFSTCIALRKDVPAAYMHRLLVRQSLNDFEGAMRDANRFLEMRPNDVQGHFNRALLFRSLRQHREADGDLTKAIELAHETDDGPEPRFYLLRSKTRHTLGDRLGGNDDLQRGLELLPNDERNFLARGMAFLRHGDPEKALRDFRAASKRNPNSLNALKNIAYVFSDHLDRNEDAIETLNMALAAKPNDAEIRSSQAVLLARVGDASSARTAIQTALETDESIPILLRAASVYALTQDNANDATMAFEYLQRALAKKPDWARYLPNDPDLKAIHTHQRFQELIGAANKLLPE